MRLKQISMPIENATNDSAAAILQQAGIRLLDNADLNQLDRPAATAAC